MIQPLNEAGVEVTGIEKLTGLAEYRNGGLFIDFGVLELKDSHLLDRPHTPGSEIIVEWRALTIILLDKLAETIRAGLHLSAVDLPLAKVLEGGTWHAGRKLAEKLREGGTSPLNIESDGTVF